LEGILVRPWGELTSAERAFTTGYLCHLAADEEWKRFDLESQQTHGFRWWAGLPVPGSVILTAFDVLSYELYHDPTAVAAALDSAHAPNVLTHVPVNVFQMMWRAVKEHAMDGRTAESFIELLGRLGRRATEIETTRYEHSVYWDDALDLTESFFGGVPIRVQAMVQRSLETVPRLLAWSG
jgi:hypothetical protein